MVDMPKEMNAKIEGKDIKQENYCTKIIADLFVNEFINKNKQKNFQFRSMPDVSERENNAPDFFYLDTKNNRNMFIEIKRVMESTYDTTRKIKDSYNEMIPRLERTVTGSFFLLIKSDVYPKFSKRNQRRSFLDSIKTKIENTAKTLSVNGYANIHETIILYKYSDEGARIYVSASDLYSDSSGNVTVVVDMLEKVAKQFEQYKTQNSRTILLILKFAGIQEWFQTGLIIKSLLRDSHLRQMFQMIDEVYEIIFDSQWHEGLTINLCHPTSATQELISDKNAIFDTQKAYFAWRNEYFRL